MYVCMKRKKTANDTLVCFPGQCYAWPLQCDSCSVRYFGTRADLECKHFGLCPCFAESSSEPALISKGYVPHGDVECRRDI